MKPSNSDNDGHAGTHHVFLLLGGNQENTITLFDQAYGYLRMRIGNIITKSAVYETEPWGMTAARVFLNQALYVRSTLSPLMIMHEILDIEKAMGRIREKGIVSPRPVDIDILFIDNMIISEPGLEVPHPRLHLRRFALQPLSEIAPDLIHPIFNTSIMALLNICGDHLTVTRLSEPPD